ncbi:putative glycosyl transferase, family 14 [Helianthus anomalus]
MAGFLHCRAGGFTVEERKELASRVENDPVFAAVGNVYVVPKANMVTYTGPTMVSNTLHACAILLKKFKV